MITRFRTAPENLGNPIVAEVFLGIGLSFIFPVRESQSDFCGPWHLLIVLQKLHCLWTPVGLLWARWFVGRFLPGNRRPSSCATALRRQWLRVLASIGSWNRSPTVWSTNELRSAARAPNHAHPEFPRSAAPNLRKNQNQKISAVTIFDAIFRANVLMLMVVIFTIF